VNEQILQVQNLLMNPLDGLSTIPIPTYILGDFNLELLKYPIPNIPELIAPIISFFISSAI
jgi:hypothetical protein